MDDRVSSAFARRRLLFAALAVLVSVALLPASGCVTLPTTSSISMFQETPVTKVVCVWDSNIHSAQDVAHNGAPFVGLAGTVYFFSVDEGRTLAPTGELVAEWYDLDAKGEATGKPLHRQVYDARALAAMKRNSPVGPAYTVFLDWPNYRPEVTRVMIHTHFTPANGRTPVYAPWSPITLHSSTPVTRHETNEQIQLAPGFVLPTAASSGFKGKS